MKETVKVTVEGYKKLSKRKEDFFKQLKETQGKKGEAAEIGGNQWHDNFSFEELCRQEMMLNNRIAQINAHINSAEVVGEPFDDEILQIGHVAILEFDDGDEREYEIVGFGESEIKATPPKVEYLAPVVCKFVGRSVGATAKVEIGGKVREITLVEIFRKEV